jgi:hypothetical protein
MRILLYPWTFDQLYWHVAIITIEFILCMPPYRHRYDNSSLAATTQNEGPRNQYHTVYPMNSREWRQDPNRQKQQQRQQQHNPENKTASNNNNVNYHEHDTRVQSATQHEKSNARPILRLERQTENTHTEHAHTQQTTSPDAHTRTYANTRTGDASMYDTSSFKLHLCKTKCHYYILMQLINVHFFRSWREWRSPNE